MFFFVVRVSPSRQPGVSVFIIRKFELCLLLFCTCSYNRWPSSRSSSALCLARRTPERRGRSCSAARRTRMTPAPACPTASSTCEKHVVLLFPGLLSIFLIWSLHVQLQLILWMCDEERLAFSYEFPEITGDVMSPSCWIQHPPELATPFRL